MRKPATLLFVISGLLAGVPALAATVEVRQALVRATKVGQGAGIGFVNLRAQQPARLIGAESPVCDSIVLHEMKREGIVLSMSKIEAIELPPGQTVQLRAGGNHLMLMRLKHQLIAGAAVPLTLTFVDEAGRSFTEKVDAVVTRQGVRGDDDDH